MYSEASFKNSLKNETAKKKADKKDKDDAEEKNLPGRKDDDAAGKDIPERKDDSSIIDDVTSGDYSRYYDEMYKNR